MSNKLKLRGHMKAFMSWPLILYRSAGCDEYTGLFYKYKGRYCCVSEHLIIYVGMAVACIALSQTIYYQ